MDSVPFGAWGDLVQTGPRLNRWLRHDARLSVIRFAIDGLTRFKATPKQRITGIDQMIQQIDLYMQENKNG